MKFTIPCETFYRLSRIISYFQEDTNYEIKQKINTIRLENYKGNLIAIATNQKIAAIEYISPTDQPDGILHVNPHQSLINISKEEKLYNSFIEFVLIPEIHMASAKTMLGFQFQGNAYHFLKDTPLDDWRSWVSEETPKTNNSAMYWDLNHLILLNESSPSGRIIFPKIIDIDIPVVLRDANNPNWVGLFVGKTTPSENKKTITTLPKWWKK